MRNGDTGAVVRDLQKLLGIESDGWYGEKTEAAVRSFQQSVGLIVDGVAGAKTLTALRTGKVDPLLLGHADIKVAANKLEVDCASVQAVHEVESRGHGFLPDGRPVILFERHVMYRRLQAAGQDADALAAKYPNIVNPLRGGYSGGAAEHFRLATAMGIDPQYALESASWGLYQIMGYHWQDLGYQSAGDFHEAMSLSEPAHLDAFVRFILVNPPIHKALKSKKWAEFARLYNGPAYRENLYDAKLARAYERHSGEVA